MKDQTESRLLRRISSSEQRPPFPQAIAFMEILLCICELFLSGGHCMAWTASCLREHMRQGPKDVWLPAEGVRHEARHTAQHGAQQKHSHHPPREHLAAEPASTASVWRTAVPGSWDRAERFTGGIKTGQNGERDFAFCPLFIPHPMFSYSLTLHIAAAKPSCSSPPCIVGCLSLSKQDGASSTSVEISYRKQVSCFLC